MEHGIIRDWNDMERIWQYIFSKEQLQTFAEEVCTSETDCAERRVDIEINLVDITHLGPGFRKIF